MTIMQMLMAASEVGLSLVEWASSTADRVSSGSVTLAGAAQPGDWIFVVATSNSASSDKIAGVPSGFTSIGVEVGDSDSKHRIARKVATGGETVITTALSSDTTYALFAFVVRGVGSVISSVFQGQNYTGATFARDGFTFVIAADGDDDNVPASIPGMISLTTGAVNNRHGWRFSYVERAPGAYASGGSYGATIVVSTVHVEV